MVAAVLPLAQKSWAATYYIDCAATVPTFNGALETPFQTLAQGNALQLAPGDSLLFKRGSVCKGELQPRGSGTAASPIHMGAYGDGSLPQIIAGPADPAVLHLTNQQFWEVQSLELSGATTYGIFVEAPTSLLQHIVLRDLLVHNIRGSLKHKESGLVVLHATGKSGSFDDVLVDGVQAFNTTQWSGIFIADAGHVQVRNSIVHDVQGDGIVVFRSHDAVISRSLAWHTGMQHQQTIGTPNAIWTWRCTDCLVEENEAFLTDSPGVDGGAFDIDYGNARNTVQRNFGHDTVGYCISIFGAFGPTTASVVADNLCLSNGLSPRLAERQGAILLMTWQGGSIDGLVIRNNRVEWDPPGGTPAVRSGADLQASGVVLSFNRIQTSGASIIDPLLKYVGEQNRYSIATSRPGDAEEANDRYLKLPEKNSTLTPSPGPGLIAGQTSTTEKKWSLIVTAATSSGSTDDSLRGTMIQLISAALQFGHEGLQTKLLTNVDTGYFQTDWRLQADGIHIEHPAPGAALDFSVKLVSPTGAVIREWHRYPGPVDLGSALRENLGAPNFAFLPFEDVRATD